MRDATSISSSARFSLSWDKNFRNAVLDARGTGRYALERAFAEGVRAVIQPRERDLLGALEERLLSVLRLELRVEEGASDYLAPMIRARPLAGIATLNYDLSVELACRRAGVTVDTGLDKWSGGYEWSWDDTADVRLLKLHGSLDYVLGANSSDVRMSEDHLIQMEPSEHGRLVNGVPAMVFGHGSKLRSDGPFLAMLVEFDRMLQQTEWLTIVGYSFRDDHINAAITRWLNGTHAQRLSIIDPSVRDWTADGGYRAKGYVARLLLALRGRQATPHGGREVPALGHDLLAVGAAEGLAQLHAQEPLDLV